MVVSKKVVNLYNKQLEQTIRTNIYKHQTFIIMTSFLNTLFGTTQEKQTSLMDIQKSRFTQQMFNTEVFKTVNVILEENKHEFFEIISRSGFETFIITYSELHKTASVTQITNGGTELRLRTISIDYVELMQTRLNNIRVSFCQLDNWFTNM